MKRMFALVLVFAMAAGASDLPGPAGLLPASLEIPLWRADGEPLSFTGENLWEYINGAAENFISFEFKEVAARDYLSETGDALKVEIYEHGSPLMAYGIYAQMRNPELTFLEIGNEAFADEYSIHFWKGPYYARVAVYESSPELDAAMRVFAGAIAAKIPESGTLPPEAACFPVDGLVARDTRYLADGVLGRSKYPPSFVATYRFEGEVAKLYLATLPDSSAARNAFDWFVGETDGSPVLVEAAGGPRRQSICKDPYRGAVVTFQFGRWLGSLVGMGAGSERGERLIRDTIRNLERLGN